MSTYIPSNLHYAAASRRRPRWLIPVVAAVCAVLVAGGAFLGWRAQQHSQAYQQQAAAFDRLTDLQRDYICRMFVTIPAYAAQYADTDAQQAYFEVLTDRCPRPLGG